MSLGALAGGAAAFGLAPRPVPQAPPVPPPAERPPEPEREPSDPLHFEVTAYCPCEVCCGRWSEFQLTASGVRPREGRTIAADWSVLPKGTRVRIPGAGVRVVEDKGGAIKGRRIDLFMESHAAALEWGRRKVAVEVVGFRLGAPRGR